MNKKNGLKNINPNDIHNIIYLNNKIVGYNCLRNMRLIQKRNKYLLFDTIIIKKVYRKLKLDPCLWNKITK